MSLSIYMTGVGGQGVLTIAELIMSAAEQRGIHCNYFPTKGMAQRGGFVKAQLRIDDIEAGPDISKGGADIVIAMEQCEALKAIDYLKPDGDMIVYGYQWLPTDVMLGKAPYPSAEEVEREAHKRTKNYHYLDTSLLPENGADNVLLLAAAQKLTALGKLFTADEILAVITERFPKGVERNKASFVAGQSV